MLIIGDVLISDELLKEEFVCQLDACLGACCWEGDFGAPLEIDEVMLLKSIYKKILPYLSIESRAVIEQKGVYAHYKDDNSFGTPLLETGACVYMTRGAEGIARCGIEQAWLNGEIDFKKPISCHLYPVRVSRQPGFEALNYERWDICSAACTLGKKLKVPVYEFVKDAIIRKYGIDFYEQLEAAALHLKLY